MKSVLRLRLVVPRPFTALLMGVALFVAGLLTTPTSAQVAGVSADDLTGERLLSDMLLRFTMQTLSDTRVEQEGDLRPDQLVRASVFLDLALELTPDDTDLWSKRANLAERAGDRVMLLKALRNIVELAPDRDATRLRLTLAEIADVETLDGRLAILEEELAAARANGYSEAYQSRIASSAATIAQEIGNEQAFLKHLKTAVRADSANGEAALLTYQLAVERGAKPLNLGAAAINIVRARPLDSDARLLLANALYNLGVYDRAVQQFEVAARMPRTSPIPPTIWPMWSSSLIASGQTAEAVDFIAQVEQQFAKPAEEGGAALGLPLDLELQLRILHGDTEPGRAALARAVAQLESRIEAGDSEAKLELAWITAVFGEDTESVTPLLEGQDRNDPRFVRATGFVFMREGAERWARSAFEQVAETDSISAYGLALLMGRDDAGRARFARQVIHDMPGSTGALLAANKLHQLGRDVMPGPNGQAIVDAMSRLPIALWRFDVDRNPWTSMRVRFDSSRTQFLEPITADLIVQNGLDIPLPIDPAIGLGTQSFVAISAFIGGQSLGQLPPQVVDMTGRLTLGPRERWTTPVQVDRSIFGMFLTSGANSTLTYNTTFTYDPRYLPNGALVRGALGGMDTARSMQAFVPAMVVENLEQWANDAVSGQGLPRYIALNRLARSGDALRSADAIDRELSQLCIDSLITAYENSGPTEQAWILLLLSTEPGRSSPFQAILDQGQRSDNDLVRVAYLFQHADEPDGNAVTTAIRDGSPVVQSFAEAMRDFLSLPPAESPSAP
ncbi:MAG: hypothetical protein AAF593_10675 [Planctomycetota bacterium]